MNHDIRAQPTQPYPTPVVTANPNGINPHSPWGKQTSSETQDDGQYHPNQQASGEIPNPSNSAKSNGYVDSQSEEGHVQANQQTPSDIQDDGQYHPNQRASGEMPNSSNSAKLNGSVDSQSEEGHVQANQQTPSAQTESTPGSHNVESPQAAQPTWQQANWPSYTPSLATVVVPSTAPIQQESSTSYSPAALAAATGVAAVTALPNHPAPGRSGGSIRAAAIALSVIVVLGFIGALIFLPLYRKRKSLQKALADQQNNSKTTIATQAVDLPSPQPHSESSRPSISGLFGPRTKKIIHLPCSVFNPIVTRTRRAPADYDTKLEKEICSVPKLATPTLSGSSIYTTSSISDAETMDRSTSSVASKNQQSDGLSAVRVVSSDSTMTEEISELPQQTRTASQEQHGVYGAASLENPSIGNLLAASPLINNVYVVEMDFVPCRDGQLELHTGQLLGISQVFDNGWALGVRLDSPEAGLVPRSHLSARPSRQQVQCSGSDDRRASQRHSLPLQSIGVLSSRFYSFFSKPEREAQNASPV